MKLRLSENFRAVFYAPFYATQALGFFAREGLDVELIGSSGPGDAVPRLLEGSIDVTWGGPMRVMKARDQDPEAPLVCFGEVVARDPFYLVGRPDIAAFSLPDVARLRFATVAEVPTPWMCLQHDLRLAGLDPATVARTTDRTMAQNVAALREGSFDVVQMFEPFVTQALRTGCGRILCSAFFHGTEVASDRVDAETYAAFNRAVREAVRRINADKSAYMHYFIDYHAKSDPEIAALKVEDLRESRLVVCDPAPIPLDEMTRTFDWLKSWGMLEETASPQQLVNADVQRFAHIAAE